MTVFRTGITIGSGNAALRAAGRWGIYGFAAFMALAAQMLYYLGVAPLFDAFAFSFALIGLMRPARLLEAFLFLLAAGHRDFTYSALQVGPARFYISEWVLVILLVAATPRIRKLWREHKAELVVWSGYFGIGTALLLISARQWPFGAVARDYALVYYSLFMVATLAHVRGRSGLNRLLLVLLLGCLPNLAGEMLNYLYGTLPTTHEQMNLSMRNSFFYLIAAGIILPRVLENDILLRKRLAFFLFLLFGVILFYSYSKTAMLGAVLLTGLVFFLRWDWLRPSATIGIIACFFMTSVLTPSAKSYSFSSVFAPDTYSNNARLLLRTAAMRDFAEYPYGIGFGSPIFGAHSRELIGDPEIYHALHNSYLSVLRRMGIPGFIALMVLIGYGLLRGYRAMRTDDAAAEKDKLAVSALLAFMAPLLFANAHVVLEGPFLGIPFWALLGALFALRPAGGSVKEYEKGALHPGSTPQGAC